MTPAARAQDIPDLVSRTALRVCADPANLPFSNRKKQGFENKIAEIVGNQLKEPVRYFFAPSGPGFIRNTLGSDLCDVVLGYALGSDIVLSTNPYYRSTYVLVAPQGSVLNGVTSVDDPRLKGHHLGVFAATPPVDIMLEKGLLASAKIYPLLVDHRFDSPLTDVLADLKAKTIDAVLVWGPLIGDAVQKSNGALVMTPLLGDVKKPGFSYRIAFGVRHDEIDWKHTLEGVIRARQGDITRVLVDYNVPLIDNAGHLIPPAEAVKENGAGVAVRRERGKGGTPAGFHMPGPAPVNGAEPKSAPPGFKMPGPPPTNAPAQPGHS